MLKSRITNIIQKPNWNPQNSNETFYVFLINLENGDEGSIYKKTNNLKLAIGQEITYTLNKKGTIKAKDGMNMYLMLVTFSDGIL